MLKYINNEQSQQDTFVAAELTLVKFKEVLFASIFSPDKASDSFNKLTESEKSEYLDVLSKITEVSKVESAVTNEPINARKGDHLLRYLESVNQLISSNATSLSNGGEEALKDLAKQKVSFAAPKGYLQLPEGEVADTSAPKE